MSAHNATIRWTSDSPDDFANGRYPRAHDWTFDGGQVVCAGALRGLTDVRIPTIITFIAYWMLALPGGYFLGVRGIGPLGIWISLATGLAFAAIFLALRFARLTGRPHEKRQLFS